MDYGPIAFEALWDALEEARASIRVGGRHVIDRALCSGMSLTREDTEQGLFKSPDVVVRTLLSYETKNAQLKIGMVIEVNPLKLGSWVKLRIAGRNDTAGVVVLTMESANE